MELKEALNTAIQVLRDNQHEEEAKTIEEWLRGNGNHQYKTDDKVIYMPHNNGRIKPIPAKVENCIGANIEPLYLISVLNNQFTDYSLRTIVSERDLLKHEIEENKYELNF